MAYWYIKFKSRDGNTYEARIYGKTGNTNVQLQGAESPFTTEEKDTDSMFEPVITQSGYLQIEDNGYDLAGNAFDWHDLVPQNSTDRSVVLYKQQQNNTLVDVWGGYIQPRTFDGEYLAYGQTRKFPLMCHLSQLESEEVNPELYETANIAKILHYLTTGFATEYVFQGEDAISEWLKIRVNWSVFADIKQNEEEVYGVIYKPKMNKLEALEGICKFFGWTCRIKARTLYFASPDSDIASLNWQSIDDEGLISIADGETDPTPTTVNWDLYEMEDPDNPFASDDNDEYYLPGVKKATVTANRGEDAETPKLDESTLKDYIEKYVQYPTSINYGGMYYFYIQESGEFQSQDSIINFESMPDPDDNTKDIGVYFEQYEYFKGDHTALQHKHNYSWSTRMDLIYRNHGNSFPLFSMKSRFPICLKKNELLSISATTYHAVVIGGDEVKKYRAAGTLYCMLRIGNYFYDGYEWRTFASNHGYWLTFEIAVGTEDNNYEQTGQIICNRTLDDPFMPYEGLGIYGTSSVDIGGILEFRICGYTCSETYNISVLPILPGLIHSVFMENLKLEIVGLRQYYLPTSNKDLEYTADSGVAYDNESEENVMLASFNTGGSGTATILDENLGYVEKLTYSEFGGSRQEHPEQQLANRMAAWGSKTRKVLNLELDTADIPNIGPANKIADYDSTVYYPLVLKRDWKEGQTTIKMIEL